jgi:hypothetical protein
MFRPTSPLSMVDILQQSSCITLPVVVRFSGAWRGMQIGLATEQVTEQPVPDRGTKDTAQNLCSREVVQAEQM